MKNYTTKRVTRYYCKFCKKGYWTKETIENHLTHCWYNPSNRTCKTCIHRRIIAGDALYSDISNIVGNKRQCLIDPLPDWHYYGKAKDVNINCDKWVKEV